MGRVEGEEDVGMVSQDYGLDHLYYTCGRGSNGTLGILQFQQAAE